MATSAAQARCSTASRSASNSGASRWQWLSIQGIAVQGASLPAGTAAGDRIVVNGHIAGENAVSATAITKVRTSLTINKANGSLRPAAMRPEPRQRPDRVAPPERAPIDRPQSFEVPKPVVPERPQIERPQDIPIS